MTRNKVLLLSVRGLRTLRLLGIDREHKSSFKFVLELHSYVKNCKSYLLTYFKVNQKLIKL